jgi:poly(hydroxyalkanoate) depolymerase family esterase
MKRLSDTVAQLRALQSMWSAGGGGGATPPAGDLQEFTEFGTNPGDLRARLHLPEALPEAAPLVVVLHGCTQSAGEYDAGSGWSQAADEAGFAVLFPEQQRQNNAHGCFNWFQPHDTGRDAGEALSIRQMIEAVVLRHGIDRRRIFITGLSAGGAMAATMLAAYPELFAGGAIIAGLPHGSATSVSEALERMRAPGGLQPAALSALVRGASDHTGPWPTISVWHGTADRVVDPSNGEAVVAQWLGVHGLGPYPQVDELVGQHRRRAWCDADGRELVEHYSVQGMGHGAPLSATGADGCGRAGPFMLDAGLSSTRRIATFWGIAAFWDIAPVAATAEPAGTAAFRSPTETIERALRAAGLVR